MNYQEQIGNIKYRDSQIRKANPEIRQIAWEMKSVPVKEFHEIYDGWSEKGNIKQFNSGELFFHGYIGRVEDSYLLVQSVPVKVKPVIYEEL